MSTDHEAVIMHAGVPAENATLFCKIRVPLGDPAAWISVAGKSIAIVRDIELDRVRSHGAADEFACPADYAPAGGLDPDRAIATAQAAAECLVQRGARKVVADRSVPFVFAWQAMQSGLELEFSAELGVLDRRVKSEQELEALTQAQRVTEQAMEMICTRIANCSADSEGTLVYESRPLTSERAKAMVAHFFLDQGFTMTHGAIVATAPHSADCHHSGAGRLKTGVPIIVDLFPREESTRYHGDCTRTVVHGAASETIVKMHQAVVEAKAAATQVLIAGNSAEQVHQAATDLLVSRGFRQSRGQVSDDPTVQHGTGHGIGLEIHEPILLDDGGGEMLVGEVFTVEPGLYGRRDGGVRIEDMLVVTADRPRNLNSLHQGLDWR